LNYSFKKPAAAGIPTATGPTKGRPT